MAGNRSSSGIERLAALTATALVLAALAACAPRLDNHGNRPDTDALGEIKPGVDTRDDVALKLGTPSSIATFDESTWYYISKKTETVAFLDPKVLDQKVVAVKFDASGIVTDVDEYSLEDGKDVQISSRQSPTMGRELTLLQQLYQTLLRGGGNTGPNEGFVR